MKIRDFQIVNHVKLDEILTELCDLVIQGQRKGMDLGMVGAALLDPDNNCVVGINYPTASGQRVHAERAAIDSYTARFGAVPAGSIMITTLNPCYLPMAERVGDSCTSLIQTHGIRKVYCGYRDPAQVDANKTFHLQVTKNAKLNALCRAFAGTFLQQLDELSFLGSTCTRDCSGHRAGYAWSKARAGAKVPMSRSPSFNNGAALQRAGK